MQPTADTASANVQDWTDSSCSGCSDEIIGGYGEAACGSPQPQAAGTALGSASQTPRALASDSAAVVAGGAGEQNLEQQVDEQDSDVYPQLVQDDWFGYESTDSDDIGVGRSCLSFDAAAALPPFPFEPQRGRGIEPAALEKFEGILQRSSCWWRTGQQAPGGGTADTSKGGSVVPESHGYLQHLGTGLKETCSQSLQGSVVPESNGGWGVG